MHRPIICSTVLAATLLAGCSGSDNPGTTPPVSRADTCAAERSLAADYTGEIVFDATGNGGPMCVWQVRARISASDRAGVACDLTMTADAPVEQLVVPPSDAPYAGVCLAADTVDAVIAPETESLLHVWADSSAPESAPYPGTSGGPLVASFALFETLQPLVASFAVDPVDGSLVPVRTRDVGGESVSGRLERVQY